MPTFESLITSAPAGFSKSCVGLNELATKDGAALDALVKRCLDASSNLAESGSDAAHIKILQYIVRSFKMATPSPSAQQMAIALDQNTLLTRECVERIIVTIQGNSATESTANQSLLSQVSYI